MLFVYSDRMIEHHAGAGHPEAPERLRAAVRALADVPGARWIEPKPAAVEDIARVHHPDYIARIDAVRGRAVELDDDTRTSAGSVDAAYLAAGAAVEATQRVVAGETKHAVALVRPPGHHAEASLAMGFCLFNNVAIAAAHARAKLGCERVLILDWDVHHGNGTQHIFEERRDVLFMSVHQFPCYPGTGALAEVGRGEGTGYTVNVPCPPGLGDGDYLHVLSDVLLPIADAYRPDLVLVSAGFDAHVDDPLAGMCLTERGYAEMTAIVRAIADRHAHGRLILLLEGGYHLEAMPRSLRACVDVLTGASAADPFGPTMTAIPTATDAGRALVRSVIQQHHSHWPLR